MGQGPSQLDGPTTGCAAQQAVLQNKRLTSFIISFLDPCSVCQCRRTCRFWQALVTPEIWECLRSRFGLSGAPHVMSPEILSDLQCASIWMEQLLPVWDSLAQTHLEYRRFSPVISAAVAHGIPKHLRRRIWPLLVGNSIRVTQSDYDKLLASVDLESNTLRQIQMDVPRTFPATATEEFRLSLQRVMSAFVSHDVGREFGYISGMSHICGIFLIAGLSERDTCEVLLNLLPKRLLAGELIRVYPSVLTTTLRLRLPDIARHLERESITPEFYSYSWVWTGFATSLPEDTVLALWDVWLCEGDAALICAAVSLLEVYRETLPTMDFQTTILTLQGPHAPSRSFIGRVVRMLGDEALRAYVESCHVLNDLLAALLPMP